MSQSFGAPFSTTLPPPSSFELEEGIKYPPSYFSPSMRKFMSPNFLSAIESYINTFHHRPAEDSDVEAHFQSADFPGEYPRTLSELYEKLREYGVGEEVIEGIRSYKEDPRSSIPWDARLSPETVKRTVDCELLEVKMESYESWCRNEWIGRDEWNNRHLKGI